MEWSEEEDNYQIHESHIRTWQYRNRLREYSESTAAETMLRFDVEGIWPFPIAKEHIMANNAQAQPKVELTPGEQLLIIQALEFRITSLERAAKGEDDEVRAVKDKRANEARVLLGKIRNQPLDFK